MIQSSVGTYQESSIMSMAINSQHYTMRLEGVEKSILSFMNHERKTDGANSCEVLLLANDIKHYAHKIVLTRFSEFFRKYFYENQPVEHRKKTRKVSNDECQSYEENSKKTFGPPLSTIHLPGINSVELEPILEYMYTSTLELKAENVNEILLVACLLQVTSVIEFCAEVLYKQPNWRSPLVSPRILNFVRQETASQKDAEGLSPTTVTWASNGAKPSSHETRSRRRGRTVSNGQATKHETLRSDIARQRRDTCTDHVTDQQLIFKNGRLPNVVSSCKGAVTNPTKLMHMANSTEEKRSFQYSPTIDYDVLERNIHLIQSGRMRSIFQRQETKPMNRRQLDSFEGKLPKEKSSFSWDINSRIPSKRPVPMNPSNHTDRGTFRRHPSRVNGDFHQSTIMPQLIDCRSLWQASALGIPVYPSSYSNFCLAQGSEAYSKATIESEYQRVHDSTAINSKETHLQRQCTASASTFSTLPRYSQNGCLVSPDSQLNTVHKELHRARGLCNNAIIPIRFQKPDSFGATDSGAQDSPMNLSQSAEMSTKTKGKFPCREPTSVRHETSVEPPTGRRDFTNSKFSYFTTPSKLDCQSSSQEISGKRSGGYIDYHRRKRKLLRGAEDSNGNTTNWSSHGEPEKHASRMCAKSRKQHCSSEDDIAAKEYNKRLMENTSESDSDDSGRPCSV